MHISQVLTSVLVCLCVLYHPGPSQLCIEQFTTLKDQKHLLHQFSFDKDQPSFLASKVSSRPHTAKMQKDLWDMLDDTSLQLVLSFCRGLEQETLDNIWSLEKAQKPIARTTRIMMVIVLTQHIGFVHVGIGWFQLI